MAVKIGKQVSNSFEIDTLFCNLINMHFEKYHTLVNFIRITDYTKHTNSFWGDVEERVW